MKLVHDQYEIRITVRWAPKPGMALTVECDKCNEPRNMLTDTNYYGTRECCKCKGSGNVRNPALEPRPPMSTELKEHIEESFNDFMDAFEHEDVK